MLKIRGIYTLCSNLRQIQIDMTDNNTFRNVQVGKKMMVSVFVQHILRDICLNITAMKFPDNFRQ